MPLKLAVLNMNAAAGIPKLYPQIDSWYIGGHALGRNTAKSHAAKIVSIYDGLLLLASYSTADLNSVGLKAISIYGSEDGVLSMEKYAENKVNLPASLEEYVIQGGCPARFGSYGTQDGDGAAMITGDAQIEETDHLLTWFFTEKEK